MDIPVARNHLRNARISMENAEVWVTTNPELLEHPEVQSILRMIERIDRKLEGLIENLKAHDQATI